ncbi:MAG: protein kinase domain-containing protein [Peptostreptococcaceae bacterium]
MDKYYAPKDIINGYTILKIIGQGRYGIVYLAENNKSEKFIIKQLKKDMLEKSLSKLFYEEEILKKLDDPSFPKFVDNFKDEDTIGYIIEYIDGTVFEDLLGFIVFKKEDIYHIASQLLDIISILQENNIVHRDIRPPNVMVKKNKDLVLIDFGLARYINNKRYVKEMDYWFLGDFLIHLYYTSYYKSTGSEEKPWYDELDISEKEILFLKKLMGIIPPYKKIDDIRKDLKELSSE